LTLLEAEELRYPREVDKKRKEKKGRGVEGKEGEGEGREGPESIAI
jgi:hypothetical protein